MGLQKKTYNIQLALSEHNTMAEALVAKAPGRVLCLEEGNWTLRVSFNLQEPKPRQPPRYFLIALQNSWPTCPLTRCVKPLVRVWPTEAPSTRVLCAGKAVVFTRPDKICLKPMANVKSNANGRPRPIRANSKYISPNQFAFSGSFRTRGR